MVEYGDQERNFMMERGITVSKITTGGVERGTELEVVTAVLQKSVWGLNLFLKSGTHGS